MTLLPSGVKIQVARCDGHAQGPGWPGDAGSGHAEAGSLCGHLFAFRGRKADLLKILFWAGTGLCLFAKRLEQSRFFWPVADEAAGSVTLSSAQLSMLIKGIDRRSAERRWRPAVAG
jgi:transposase